MNPRESNSLNEAIQVPLPKKPLLINPEPAAAASPNPIYVQRPIEERTDQNNIAGPRTNVKPPATPGRTVGK